jgi:hypothetical protein
VKIQVIQPHPDYPMAWIYVDTHYKKDDPEKLGFDLAVVLSANQITIIGPWKTESMDGPVMTMKAPVLLEDQHTKPPKQVTRSRKKE